MSLLQHPKSFHAHNVFWTVLEGYNDVVIFCILQLYFLICFLVLQTFLSFIFCLYSIK